MAYLQKYVFEVKQNTYNFKRFNRIRKIYEAKTLVKHILCNCIFKFNSTKVE